METLKICLITFNCGRALLDVDRFAEQAFPWNIEESPDLIVLSLQEVAPIAQSFLGGRVLVPYLKRFVDAFKSKDRQVENYQYIASRNVGMTAIMILAKSALQQSLDVSEVAGVGVGNLQLGNKGAVALRLAARVDGEPNVARLTFVAAHLAPMEENWLRRNEDWRNIVRGLAFKVLQNRITLSSRRGGGGRAGENAPLLENEIGKFAEDNPELFCEHVPLFLAGDLNYRTSDVKPPLGSSQNFPKPSEYRHKTPEDLPNVGGFESFKNSDQLSRERSAGRTLHHLDELPVMFPPTYKYSEKANDLWPTDGSSEPEAWIWAKHRCPSWCDRILFSSELLSDTSTPFKPIFYRALPLQPTSDHRPVVLYFSLDLRGFASHESPIVSASNVFPLNPRAHTDRAFARALELIVGLFAYVAMTWEGNAILLAVVVGALGGWIITVAMLDT